MAEEFFLGQIFATPTECWNSLIAALKAGDVERAQRHFVPGGTRARYRGVLEALGPAGMQRFASELHALPAHDLKGGLVTVWLARRQPDGTTRVFEVAFIQSRLSGTWLIDSM
jgi:hypothetical protein